MEVSNRSNYLVKTDNLFKTYKEYHAVNEVSMTINKGDIYGFIGKNGAGKTTFIRLITQLIEKSSGNLTFNSVNKMKMGAVIEGPVCYPYLSARDNLNYYAIQRNIKNKKRIDEVLEFVGLANVDKKKVFKDYSLGMKQRLGIGLAILDNPEFLILDEPVNGLDPQGIVEIREIIHRLNTEFGTTILISSHILTELSLVASRYGIINEGSLIKELTSEELAEECGRSISLKSSTDSLTIELLSKNNYQVEQKDGFIVVKAEKETMPAIAKLLFENNIYLTHFEYREENLEEYYLNLIDGRAKHD
ncbi:ABC-2 type transport system ATP-binding protein [Enterococcus sp. DIV0212c]|uniref:ATP-binding cassette domain-containing protein n=1 Tax=Enterococcus sp. DIV0212c TaxID=2230867 RepID=UPI001A9B697C|nr:ATP-binding cassette domain-containing protein [Enterococcus sp. DIV0212c]MBO1354511.1 ATP-binding cassette domain-containing protein [Enterococcus sp. DIV0212c]